MALLFFFVSVFLFCFVLFCLFVCFFVVVFLLPGQLVLCNSKIAGLVPRNKINVVNTNL